jgi:hypothetical protein
MGVLSKVWKGIKKTVKKIGKGIKKVFGKVASAFNKLGIVGQLGLAVLMPYALGALSSFAGAALGKVGTWSATLLKSSNVFANAVGYGLKGVHMAGTAIGNMYTSITETISAGVDKTKEFFGFGPTETVDLTKAVSDDIIATTPISPETPYSFTPEYTDAVATGSARVVDTGAIVQTTTKSLLEPGVITEVAEKATTNIFQDIGAGVKKLAGDINITNPESQIRQDIANFSAYDYAKTTATGAVEQAVVGGVVAAGQQKVAGALGYKVPNSNQTYINLPEMQAAGRHVGKYNEATLWAQENGNNFVMQSFRPRDYVAEAFGNEDSVATYFAKMQKQLFNQDQNNTLFTGTA